MRVEKIDADTWKNVSTEAHGIVFNEKRDPDMDRIDYAIVAIDDNEQAQGYATCREVDKYTVYLQYGGAFFKGKYSNVRGYRLMIEWIKSQPYKQAITLVENTNLNYLKLAMKFGFLVVGCRNYRGDILLELFLDLEE